MGRFTVIVAVTVCCLFTVSQACSCPSSTPNFCAPFGCVDFTNDRNNCGSCGNACPSDSTCNAGVCDPLTVSSGPINLSIPDNNYAGISSTLTVNAAGRVVASVSVTFNIVHTWDSDLIINLKAPNGQVLNLVDRKGGSGKNFINTVISSTATVSVNTGSAPFTGTYSPSAVVPTLAPTAFISTTGVYTQLFSQPSGSWIFAVADVANRDVGILQNWAITLNFA